MIIADGANLSLNFPDEKMQKHPDMLELLSSRVLKDLQKEKLVDEAKLMKFNKLIAEKQNPYVIKYFNDIDALLNDYGYAPDYMKDAIYDLISKPKNQMDNIFVSYW